MSDKAEEIIAILAESARNNHPEDRDRQTSSMVASIRKHPHRDAIETVLIFRACRHELNHETPKQRSRILRDAMSGDDGDDYDEPIAPTKPRLDQEGIAADAVSLMQSNRIVRTGMLTIPFVGGRIIGDATGTELAEHGTTMIAQGRTTAERGMLFVLAGRRAQDNIVGDVLTNEDLERLYVEAKRKIAQGEFAA